MHARKVLIPFEGLLQGFNRLIVLAGIAEPFTDSGFAEGREGVKLPGAFYLGDGLLVPSHHAEITGVPGVRFARFGFNSIARLYSRSAASQSQPLSLRLASA